MRTMGLQAIYPQPRLSQGAPGHKIYPYLLRNMPVVRPDQVWSTDSTYVRLRHGFVYLVAVMDWYSRYVLSWEVSVTMDSNFCVTALEWALRTRQPEIFNKDYRDVGEAVDGLAGYFHFYNRERPHQSLGYRTPKDKRNKLFNMRDREAGPRGALIEVLVGVFC